LQGKYGTQAIYGDNEGAGVGLIDAQGNGNASASFTLNLPGFGLKRSIIEATATGTYKVKSDGTMPIEFTITLADSISIDETADCVIMQADNNKLATEVFCAVKEPLTPMRGFKRGGIIIMTFKRLPD